MSICEISVLHLVQDHDRFLYMLPELDPDEAVIYHDEENDRLWSGQPLGSCLYITVIRDHEEAMKILGRFCPALKMDCPGLVLSHVPRARS